MPNDGTTAAPAAPAAMPATSDNFMTAVRANAALPEPAPAAAPASTPSLRNAAATPARAPGADVEGQFGGQIPDVPFDEPSAAADGTEAVDAQAAPEVDDFIDAEVIDLDAEIHGVKARDLLAAIKAGTVPPDVAAKLGLAAPALDEMYFAEGEFPGMKGSEVLAAIKAGEVMSNDALRQIPVSVKVDGKPLVVSAREAGDGYQRMSDTSRKNKLIAAQKAHLDYRDSTFNEMLDAWRKDGAQARAGAKRFGFLQSLEAAVLEGFNDPAKLRQTLTRRGFGDPLLEVAKAITREEIELHEMSFNADGTVNPRGKAIADRLRKEKADREVMDRDLWTKDEALRDAAEERELQKRIQQRRQQQQQQQPSATQQQIVQRIEMDMPAALRAVGLRPVKLPDGSERVATHHENTFAAELGELIAAYPGQMNDAILATLIKHAAQATAEVIGDEAGASGGVAARALPSSPAAAQVAAASQQRAAAPPAAAAPVQRAPAPNPSPLSPRPGATPTAPASATPFQQGGSSEDFASYTAQLKRGGRR